MPKKKTDAELNYAVGSWWKDSRGSLLLGVKEKRSIIVCLNSQGRVDSSTWVRDRAHFEKIVRSALSEWFSVLGSKVQVFFSAPPCKNELSQGNLQVSLHYDEAFFQTRIAQTASPTLGVFLTGDGGLHLNVRGVLNPSRDATAGYKTTLHELGHAMGLTHSQVAGAVMQANLSLGSSSLTPDDIAGLKAIWNRLGQASPMTWGGNVNPAQPNSSAAPASESQPKSVPLSGLTMRYDSWFKLSTAQSYLLPEREKCAVRAEQKVVVQILDRGALQAGHLRVALAESLPGCSFASAGTVGFLYRSHID